MAFNLNEEVICNHLVTSQVKDLWRVQMETSIKILEVCDKYNLKIWAEGGTLLGAVRHQGFIPWDDDMDFVMMRDDYEKFKIIGPREFQYPYFFQSFNTDNWAGGLVRVCRSDTTMIDERFKKLKPHNYGIFVDVIVMDGIPHSEQVYAKECKKVERMMRLLSRYCEFKPDFSNIRATLRSVIVKAIFMFINPQKYHERIVQLLSSYDIGSHPTCGKIQLGSRFNFGPKKIKRRNCSWYSDTEWLSFHDMKLPAPKEWNNVLTSQFGKEYMTPQKSPSWHKVSIIDTKRSYVDILSEIEGKA